MRKTLFAMLGLVAIGVCWALPVLAGFGSDGPPKVEPDYVPPENRSASFGAWAGKDNAGYRGTLSGTLINQSQVTTSYFLYPGACADRYAGTWAAKSNITADSLNTYTPNSFYPYDRVDQSLPEKLWHATDGSDAAPALLSTLVLTGTRSIWCGKTDAAWVVKSGYPNLTFQILYIDTGTHGANYTMTMTSRINTEQNYDYLYLIGGGSAGQPDHEDPLTNSRVALEDIIANNTGGPHSDSHLLVTWTGVVTAATPGALNINAVAGGAAVTGAGAGTEDELSVTLTLAAADRALYFVFTADCLFSSEDGLWPFGNGQILDDIKINGVNLYTDGDETGSLDLYAGSIIASPLTPAGDTDGITISARVPPGQGAFWQFAAGNTVPLEDSCSPQKQLANDLFFRGTDPLLGTTVDKQISSIVTCTFAVPTGTASILAVWGVYGDLPRFAGMVRYAEYRQWTHEPGMPVASGGWSTWNNTRPAGSVSTGATKAWFIDFNELASAVQADSFQVRYNIQCIPPFASNRTNCEPLNPGVLYDDLFIQVTTGVPAPIFGIFPGSVAQSTFVDGTFQSGYVNCTSAPCWPGNRGTGLQTNPNIDISDMAILDNFNSPTGDSITLSLATGLRKGGMGVNWRMGYDKAVGRGLVLTHTNGAYNVWCNDPLNTTPGKHCAPPAMIYRLYDPATNAWSPFDSTELFANSVSVTPTESTLIDQEFRVNWPPADKAGKSLPPAQGAWQGTINGLSAYNDLAFLPKGTRMQYYFKAVDINGGVSYTFSTDNTANEVDDLPVLPGTNPTSIKAPDIIEWRVLPSVYQTDLTGLLNGVNHAKVLNLDGVHTTWSAGLDPMTQALRGLGVRADRYRHLASGTTSHNIGGHELPGQRLNRLSNFFPNVTEWNLVERLADAYRIFIQSSHTRTSTVLDEPDAVAVKDWAITATKLVGGTAGPDGGDRCIFYSGDNSFNLFLAPSGVSTTNQVALANEIFGLANADDAWSGTAGNAYPTIDDRFAAQSAGPALATALTFTYPVDGGCAVPNRFDDLTKEGDATAANVAYYPGGVEVAAVATMREKDTTADNDRVKAIGYGFSFQYIRTAGIPTTAANYVRSGAENRMRVLYKFLASCRGQRSGQTAQCWPCPTDANGIGGDWNLLAGFNTATYGPLYQIQSKDLATGVEIEEPSAAPRANILLGNNPNPFNPSTKISFVANQAGKVSVRIFNVGGQLVRTLTKNVTAAGPDFVSWDGKGHTGKTLSSGVYFYKLKFADGSESGSRMTMLK